MVPTLVQNEERKGSGEGGGREILERGGLREFCSGYVVRLK